MEVKDIKYSVGMFVTDKYSIYRIRDIFRQEAYVVCMISWNESIHSLRELRPFTIQIGDVIKVLAFDGQVTQIVFDSDRLEIRSDNRSVNSDFKELMRAVTFLK